MSDSSKSDPGNSAPAAKVPLTREDIKDWSALKYFVAQELGEEVRMLIGTRKNGVIHWYARPHYVSDGAGFMYDILLKEHPPSAKIPQSRVSKPPKVYQWPRHILQHAKQSRAPKKTWKGLGRKQAEDFSCIIFNREETARLNQLTKDRSTNLNGLILRLISEIFENGLLKGIDTQLWLVPVNMRGAVPANTHAVNLTSSLSLPVHRGETARDISNRIIKLYRNGSHWGAWVFSNLGRYIGEKNLKRFLSAYRSPYMGVMSSMGTWARESSETLAENAFGCPPCTTFAPVAVAHLIWQGAASISLQVHPDLKVPSQKIITELLAKISEADPQIKGSIYNRPLKEIFAEAEEI